MNKSSFNQNLLNRFIVERKAYDVYREYRLSTLAFSILILCIMKLVDAPSFVFWSFISCLFVLFVFFNSERTRFENKIPNSIFHSVQEF